MFGYLISILFLPFLLKFSFDCEDNLYRKLKKMFGFISIDFKVYQNYSAVHYLFFELSSQCLEM